MIPSEDKVGRTGSRPLRDGAEAAVRTKILLIDDRPEVLHMVSYMLENAGYRVLGARSGKEGLELAPTFQPDLILCDIMMPGMSGYDVFRAARRDPDLATVPFIFLTAKAAPEDLRMGMKLGADDYLTKPFSIEELVGAIEAQLKKYGKLRGHYEQKMDMLREGLSTILPHELRTPLTLILAHSSLLIEDFDAMERASVLKDLETIHESALRLHRLIENLLMYVQLKGDATLPLEHPLTPDAQEVAAGAAVERAEAYARDDDLQVRAYRGALAMHPFHLRKIVAELVDNAFKFSMGGDLVEVVLSREGDGLHLQVTDAGRGLSPGQVEHIDAYVQFDRARLEQQGGGLGLVITKRLVELYHGALEVASQPGLGTTVHVRIPDVWKE